MAQMQQHQQGYLKLQDIGQFYIFITLQQGMLKYLLWNTKRNISFDPKVPFTQIITMLKTQYRKNPLIISTYNYRFTQYFLDLISARKWSQANQILDAIDIVRLGKWKYVRMIAQKIKQTLNNDQQIIQVKNPRIIFGEKQRIQNLNFYNRTKLMQIIQILARINYQLSHISDKKRNQTNQSRSTEESNQKTLLQKIERSQNSNFLKRIIRYLENSQNQYEKLVVSSHLIRQFPQLFDIQKVQNFILRNCQTRDILLAKQINKLIPNGLLSNCWSSEFKSSLLQKSGKAQKIIEKSLMHLKFADPLYKTQILTNKDKNLRSRTQAKIRDLLFYLDYQYKSQIFINGFQVDFVFLQKILIQYNGFNHYKSNCDELVPTVRQKWKRECLHKRGFSYYSISFQQWDNLQNDLSQRNFLVNKVENAIIKEFLNPE